MQCTCGTFLTAKDVVSFGVARCPKCGKEIVIPTHEPPRIKSRKKKRRPVPEMTFRCPRCQHECRMSDTICTGCGLDFKTGQKASVPIGEAAPEAGDLIGELKAKFGSYTMILIGIAVVALALSVVLLVRSCQ